MPLPHLLGVKAAIAAEKFVATARLDYSQWRVRPGEAADGVGDRWLCFLAGFETLLWRCDDFVGRNLRCAKLADVLG
jgi:hypothetical protein